MNETQRITFLDFARGFAIATIVVYHCLRPISTGVWAKAIMFGGTGVHMFLLLSGFGLTVSCLRRSLDGFYRRRLRKIMVPYYLFVTLIFVLNFWIPLYRQNGLYAWLGHVLLFKMFYEQIIGSFGYHLWFLSTLFQFYLIFPLLFVLLKRIGASRLLLLAIATSVIASVLIAWTGHADERVFSSSCLVYMWEFVLGMVAGQRFLELDERWWEIGWGKLLPITLVGMGLQAVLALRGGVYGQLFNNAPALFGYAGALVICYRLALRGILPGLLIALTRLSDFSYELYLTHGVILAQGFLLLQPTGLLPKLAVVVLLLTIAVIVAWAYHHLVQAIERRKT